MKCEYMEPKYREVRKNKSQRTRKIPLFKQCPNTAIARVRFSRNGVWTKMCEAHVRSCVGNLTDCEELK